MDQIEIVKKQLKEWETKFTEEHKHKPLKDDINNGPSDIIEAYKTYARLKKQVKSTMQDDVWSKKLNKSAEKEDLNCSATQVKSKTSAMDKIGQKLSMRLSQTPGSKKNIDNTNDKENGHRADTPIINSTLFSKAINFTNKTKCAKKLPATNDVSFTPRNYKRTTVPPGWLKASRDTIIDKHTEGNTKTEQPKNQNSTHNSDIPCIQHQDEIILGLNQSCGSTSKHNTTERPESEKMINDFDTSFDDSFDFEQVERMNQEKIVPDMNSIKHRHNISTKKSVNDNYEKINVEKSKASLKHSQGNSMERKNNVSSDSDDSFDEMMEKNKRRRLKRIKEKSIMPEVLKTKTSTATRKSVKRKAVVEEGNGGDELDEEFKDNDLHESDVENELNTIDSRQADGGMSFKRRKLMPSKSKASGMNENFVRLNMKGKTYRRKGKGMTGPQYKRMQWKQKMADRSKSYGATKCYKCGEEGHWAKQCKEQGNNAKVDFSEIPMSKKESKNTDQGRELAADTVLDTDFPTLTEASRKARGITVTTRQDKEEGGESSDEVESHIVRTRPDTCVQPTKVDPYYNFTESELPEEVPDEVYEALEKFGYDSFRSGQKETIMRILSGHSTLVVLSTGAGKSLCYQLPAYMYAKKTGCITLVISPLVSLMEDQVTGLPPGVVGACIHTNMTKVQRSKVIEKVKDGQVHFLLMSPEALVSAGGQSMGGLLAANGLPPVAFACIDEAHCLSEWSHHFRPSYLRLCKVLKERLGVKCFLGLTATATLTTAASVAQHLGILNFQMGTIRGAPVPHNLVLSVSRDQDRDEALINLLQGERFSKCDSIIIYCTRREQTDRLATVIRTCLNNNKSDQSTTTMEPPTKKGKESKKKKGKGANLEWYAECYHAGMSAAQRKRVQNAFMNGRLRVVVATVAFGMGLDKSDVRSVIHYNMPKTFENYVQEIGRAGRDGLPAQCHLFLDPEGQDTNEIRKHIYGNTVDRTVLKKLLRRIFKSCKCRKRAVAKSSLDSDDDVDITSSVAQPAVDVPMTCMSSPPPLKRECPGHERGLSVNDVVMDLDVKEEGISTLLYYLELHSKRWIENLMSVYTSCKIQCYGGPKQLLQVAKKCPPVAVAIAKEIRRGESFLRRNDIDFDVIDVADCMGWESGPVKRELKLLQWEFGPSGPRKTGVMVEFSDLAFHLMAPGDLSEEELDEVLDFLDDRVTAQERTGLYQLETLYTNLKKFSYKEYWLCAESMDEERSEKLKKVMTEYFEARPSENLQAVNKLSFSREVESKQSSQLSDKAQCHNSDQVRADIRAFIHLYQEEHVLTGRCIARIFYGVPSPCFPTETWSRVRRFWRCHLQVEFNLLKKMATQELIAFR